MIEVVQYESIRKLCAEKGLSERSIARLLRVSRNTVAKYRDGEVIPRQREPFGKSVTRNRTH